MRKTGTSQTRFLGPFDMVRLFYCLVGLLNLSGSYWFSRWPAARLTMGNFTVNSMIESQVFIIFIIRVTAFLYITFGIGT